MPGTYQLPRDWCNVVFVVSNSMLWNDCMIILFRILIHLMQRMEKTRKALMNHITFAEFGREAFELYLHKKRKEEKNAQLAETCRIFESKNKSILNKWAGIEVENWPA